MNTQSTSNARLEPLDEQLGLVVQNEICREWLPFIFAP